VFNLTEQALTALIYSVVISETEKGEAFVLQGIEVLGLHAMDGALLERRIKEELSSYRLKVAQQLITFYVVAKVLERVAATVFFEQGAYVLGEVDVTDANHYIGLGLDVLCLPSLARTARRQNTP